MKRGEIYERTLFLLGICLCRGHTRIRNGKNLTVKGNGNIYFIFSFERTLTTMYIIFYRFFHISLTSTNILIERNEMSAIVDFCRYAYATSLQGHAIFLSRQPLVILHSKLYSVCLSKYQYHSKPLKHLPVNIWSAKNTFIWLIPVLTSPKPVP